MDLLETKLKARIAEFAPFGLLLTDKKGKIIYVNKVFENITGWTLEEIKGETPRILKSGEMSDDYYKRLWAKLLSGGEWYEKIVNKKKNGDLYHAMQKIVRIEDDGKLIGYIAMQEDVTYEIKKEEKLRKEINSLRRLLEKDD